jgi:hypothetical protein
MPKQHIQSDLARAGKVCLWKTLEGTAEAASVTT